MPSYFFHVSFELYPQPQTGGRGREDIFLPPPDTDIFQTSFPSHRSLGWWSEKSSKRQHGRFKSTAFEGSSYTPKGDTQAGDEQAPQSPIRSTTPVRLPHGPASIHENKPHYQPKRTNYPPKDWRFSRVAMESINMASPETHTGARARGRSVSFSNNGIGVGSGGLATKGRFVPTDSRNTELGWGIVHLYRDAEETPGLYDMTEGKPSSGGSSKADEDAPTTDNNKGALPDDCTTLCILAVPSYLTPSDFLGFVGEKTRDQVSHFRMIRTGRINRYMVLMKFRGPAMAREWRSEWNGKAFNSMEVRGTTDTGGHGIVAKSDFQA